LLVTPAVVDMTYDDQIFIDEGGIGAAAIAGESEVFFMVRMFPDDSTGGAVVTGENPIDSECIDIAGLRITRHACPAYAGERHGRVGYI